MKKIFQLAIVIIAMCFSHGALSNNFEIAAVVGDDAILQMDVKERVELAISSSGLKATKDMRSRLYPQMLRVLIDESLYRQEAKRLNITVSEMEVKSAIANLEVQNKIKAGSFEEFLKGKGINPEPAIEQLEAQLLWNKIIARKVRPNIVITDIELDEKLEHIAHSSGKSELNYSEIVLPIDENNNEKSVRSLANRLIDEIKEGAEFASVAKELSIGASSDHGWVDEDNIDSHILSKIRNLRSGEISDVFKFEDSYRIVRLNDRRALVLSSSEDAKIGLKQAFFPFKEGVSIDAKQSLKAKIRRQSEKVKGCRDFKSFANEADSALSPEMMYMQMKDLNNEIRGPIEQTSFGSMTDLIEGPNGLYIFMVCKRPEPKASVVLEERVRDMLLRRKIELQAQHYLRNLRQSFYIEVRA